MPWKKKGFDVQPIQGTFKKTEQTFAPQTTPTSISTTVPTSAETSAVTSTPTTSESTSASNTSDPISAGEAAVASKVIEENGIVNHTSTLDKGDNTAISSSNVVLELASGQTKTTADSKKAQEETEDTTPARGKKKKKKDKDAEKIVGVFELFRYADKLDVLLMVFGSLGACIAGCTYPVNLLIYGNVVTIFIEALNQSAHLINNTSNDSSVINVYEEVHSNIVYFCANGVVCLITAYVGISLWSVTAERQMRKIRVLYFEAILRQEIGWFDTHETGTLNSQLAGEMVNLSEGMGDKLAVFIQWMSTFFGAYIMAIILGWKLALTTASFSPPMILATVLVTKYIRSRAAVEARMYAKAGAVAEEVLRAIRTVHVFDGQEKEAVRYEKNLDYAKNAAVKKGIIMGIGTSALWAIIFFAFAFGFWYGVVLIQTEGFEPGKIISIFFSILIGSMSLGQSFPNLESLATARGAAAKIYDVIDSKSVIDISSKEGTKLSKLRGEVEFKNVNFCYPSRKEIQILKDMNLKIPAGKTVALVGPSGCGKSTTVQLIQRFYDAVGGEVLIDGHNIKELNLRWLREQIGVVSQEPVLFATTIAENIRYGNMEVSQEEIETASRAANAHNFISELPQGYETVIGERGAQLSGGQKQRIAIARALVRNPKILLLDEATSALDQESEATVQEALERAGVGRTTIVIAHRLSTVKNADVIVGISDGEVVEQGTHESLQEIKGLYYNLVQLQTRIAEETKEDLDDIEIVEESDDSLSDKDAIVKTPFRRSMEKGAPGKSLVARTSFRRRSARLSARAKKDGEEKKGKKKSKKEKEEAADVPTASIGWLLRMNSPEWYYILLGSLAAIIGGVVFPAFAFIFSEFIRVFSLGNDREEQNRMTTILSLVMVGIGVMTALLRVTQFVAFGKSGAGLCIRLRSLSFRSMLRQDMEFFDSPQNQVGALTTRLARDASLVQVALGNKLGMTLGSLSILCTSLFLAFVYSWKLTFVVLCFMPIMMVSGFVQNRMMTGFAEKDKVLTEKSGKICSEAVDNIRTVASLTREETFLLRYENLIELIYKAGRKRAWLFGVTYGISQSITYFAYAAAFTYGSWLVQYENLEFFLVFRVFSAIMFCGQQIGRQSAFGPDFSKAKVAAGRLFSLIEQKPKIDSSSTEGTVLPSFNGDLEIRDAVFRYPTRPNIRVLKGLTLRVTPGETLALVGPSGCGKSTCIQLMERFYDTEEGFVIADQRDIKDLNLKWYRSQIGLVSQEPILFDRSIADNIAYGDNSRTVAMDEIIAAARSANIHQFINELPKGYDTGVGDKGTQLSGGQKQRIAIARALLRNPKVLLLDEATSALDSESERIVQEALDRARNGRTCVVIAHRLSTIQNADSIAVVDSGVVIERGTHSELVAKKGAYYSLLQAQNRTKKDGADS